MSVPSVGMAKWFDGHRELLLGRRQSAEPFPQFWAYFFSNSPYLFRQAGLNKSSQGADEVSGGPRTGLAAAAAPGGTAQTVLDGPVEVDAELAGQDGGGDQHLGQLVADLDRALPVQSAAQGPP